MNKIFKGVVLSLFALAGLASCSDDFDYTPATVPTGAQVYFPTSNESSYTLTMSDDIQTIDIPIVRADNADAITVGLQLTVAQNVDAFSIPSQISFAAGQSETIVPLSYDATALGYESSDTLYITIADESYTTPYGISSYKCVVNLPSPLKLLGTGKWSDDYMFEVSDIPVEIYQNELNPNIFRIMLNYEAVLEAADGEANGLQSPYTDVTLLQVGDELGGVPITQPNMVYFTPFDMGYANSTGEMVSYHPVDFSSSWSRYFETSYVDQYQENGLPGVIKLSGLILVDFEGGRGWAPCQSGEPIATITFPGFEPKDYSAELSYAGIFTDASNSVYAVGNLSLGEDAKIVKAIVMSVSDDAAAVADAIAAGDLDAVNVEEGRIEVPIAEGLTGKLQLIAVVLDGGAVKALATANFEYYGDGGASPWKSLGIGVYIDDFVVTQFGEDAYTPYDPFAYYVEIQESTETAGLYRMVNAYAPVAEAFGETGGNENIEIHAEDPQGVYIPTQPVGMNFGDGDISIVSEGGRYVENYGFDLVKAQRPDLLGTLEEGIITFPLIHENTYDIDYQGITYFGASGYYAGMNGAVTIVLPSALENNAKIKAKAETMKKAMQFEHRLNANRKAAKKRPFSKIAGKVAITAGRLR